MRIAILGTWHRRCGIPYYWRRALRALGHEVMGIGSWREEEPFGTYGRESDVSMGAPIPAGASIPRLGIYLTGEHTHCWPGIAQLLPWIPDLLLYADGGEAYPIEDPPMSWVHLSSEGARMAWSRDLTPFRYSEIMCNGCDDGVTWLPKAYDVREHWMRDEFLRDPAAPKAYDLVQLATPRDARRALWRGVTEAAPDLCTLFGEIWGPAYAAAYQHARMTVVCSTLDFVTSRVFEAMAMGCVVAADRTTAMAALFTEDEHYIGYDPIPGPGGEGMPDPQWLIDTARRLKRDGDGGMAMRAHQAVAGTHSYQERARRVLKDVFG